MPGPKKAGPYTGPAGAAAAPAGAAATPAAATAGVGSRATAGAGSIAPWPAAKAAKSKIEATYVKHIDNLIIMNKALICTKKLVQKR